jgi:hypothetical protein
MNKQSNYTELKAIVKTISKYIENVNPNTPYQQNLKRDIKHIINVLDEDNIESWITCTKYISENYAFILTHRGFSYLSEDTIRQQGKSWNYKNLTTMAQTLEDALKAECTVKSAIEAGIEYGVEKLIGWMIKN